MFRIRAIAVSVLGLAILLGGPAQAQWGHRVDSLLVAEESAQKHPADLLQTIVMPTDLGDEKLYFCAAYGRNFKKSLENKGKVKVTFRATRFDDEGEEIGTEKITTRGNVRGNVRISCKETTGLRAGDIVTSTWKFSSMTRMRSKNDPAILAITAVSLNELTLEDFLPGGNEPDNSGGDSGGGGGGSGDGGGGGGGGSGGGSATSNSTAAQVLRGCATSGIGVQFQWDQGQLKVDRRVGSAVTTIGPFSSFAAAANAAKAKWNCGSGGAVSAADGNEMNRLANWGGVSGRRLALRFEQNGGSQVHVDAWSSATGALHGSAFSTVGAAIRNFCGRSNISC